MGGFLNVLLFLSPVSLKIFPDFSKKKKTKRYGDTVYLKVGEEGEKVLCPEGLMLHLGPPLSFPFVTLT